MSAFVVSTETMQRVIAAFTDNGSVRDGIIAGEYLLRTSADLDKLGNALFSMNMDAVNYRYPGQSTWAQPLFRYRPLGPIPETDRYFACACLLYQCSEGSVPDCALYGELERVHDRLARSIAGAACSRVNTPWDWPERGSEPPPAVIRIL